MMLKPLRVEVTADPASGPILIADAMTHCQLEDTENQTQVQQYLDAATRAIQKLLHTETITSTLEAGFVDFPSDRRAPLVLPRRPATAVNSVTYIDTNNTQQTLATSLWDFVDATPYGHVLPAWNQIWPETRAQPGAENVTVEFVAGYADAASVPKTIRNAILMLTRDLYDNRNTHQTPEAMLTANPNYKMLLGIEGVPNV